MHPEERRRQERGENGEHEGAPISVPAPRCKSNRRNRREREHDRGRGRGAAREAEESDERVTDRNFDLLEHMQDRRIAAHAREADHGPTSKEEHQSDTGTDGQGAPAPRDEEPDREGPEEELEERREGRRHPCDDRVVPMTPTNGDAEQQKRRKGSQRDRVDRGCRDERDAVATPVFDTEDAQRGEDRDEAERRTSARGPAPTESQRTARTAARRPAGRRTGRSERTRRRDGRHVRRSAVDDGQGGRAEDAEVLE